MAYNKVLLNETDNYLCLSEQKSGPTVHLLSVSIVVSQGHRSVGVERYPDGPFIRLWVLKLLWAQVVFSHFPGRRNV